ncbi:MAG: pyrroline-5-carboxylate reductase [Chitinivibrionia bacterium]|nr:pyrroline-5-carboxylate reductase [Chitinivibrionia bacterium]
MKICVLGCGNMGGAIINGLRKTHSDCEMEVWDTVLAKAQEFEFEKVKNPLEWFSEGEEEPDAIIIAVKPQVIKEALTAFEHAGTKTLWISIAAGITIESIEKMLPYEAKVVRVMSNTPALIGEACSLYSINNLCNDDDKKTVEYIFNAIGVSYEIPESQMNVATGLSGSGPAFVYTIIEAFAEAGVAAGLSYQLALKCAAKTILGSAKMVLETNEYPSVLKSRVMSPGGTTATGNIALENGGVRGAIMSAVISAVEKADKLGKIHK